MKIYYAHSRMKYNTIIEQYELALIRKRFPDAEIINPNGTVDQNQSEESAMQKCLKLVDKCGMLVFSSVDGVIGKGVYQEVLWAEETGMEPLYIFGNGLCKYKFTRRITKKNVTSLNLKDTGITENMIYAIVL